VSRRTENAESYLLGMTEGNVTAALEAFSEDAVYWESEKMVT